MTAQTLAAVRESDVVVFMVDVRAGLTPMDSHFATWLRRNIGTKPIIVVANKGEGKMTETDAMEFASLGISNDAPLLMSAEHNEGMDDLYQALNQALPAQSAEADLKPTKQPVAVNKAVTSAKLDEIPDDKADAELLTMMKEAAKEPVDRSVLADAPPITLAIIGRPNGTLKAFFFKRTFLNIN
jgi:GTP-binding protein